MMLRSSSTPILNSLCSSYSESPNNYEFNSPKNLPKNLFFHKTSPLNLITSSSSYNYNSSPLFNADFESKDTRKNHGFRRAQSEGNLEGLVSGSCNNSFDGFKEFKASTKKYPRRINFSVLQTIPSLSKHGARSYEYDSDEEEEEEEEYDEKRGFNEVDEQTDVKNEDIYLQKNTIQMMNLSSENRNMVEFENESYPYNEMHLAKGFGSMISEFNGDGGARSRDDCELRGGFGDREGVDMEEFYQRMMEENPGNPLFLRNHAQFLYQTKKDLGRVEEYYSRAILVDPGDAESLSNYAQLTWQLHGDEPRASTYFQRAVQTAPENSHVHAAYAGFLWETEEETENDMPCDCETLPLQHDLPCCQHETIVS